MPLSILILIIALQCFLVAEFRKIKIVLLLFQVFRMVSLSLSH